MPTSKAEAEAEGIALCEKLNSLHFLSTDCGLLRFTGGDMPVVFHVQFDDISGTWSLTGSTDTESDTFEPLIG